MEYLLTSDEMRGCDRESIESGKVSGSSLMDKASLGVAKVAVRLLGDVRGKRIAVLCGKGNNGGDGFGASLYLAQMGASVSVLLTDKPDEIPGDAKIFYDKLNELPPEQGTVEFLEIDESERVPSLDDFNLVIDAVLGTGLSGDPRETAEKAINMMLRSRTPVLSVDIPTGLNSDDGTVYTIAPDAVATATMGNLKRGLLLNDGKEKCGKVYVVDIGIPKDLAAFREINTYLVGCEDVRSILPKRQPETHKHAVGKIFGLVGSVGLTGAGVMVGQAAMRAGAGAVVLGVPSDLNPIFENKLTEVMTIPLPQTADGSLSLAVLLQIQRNLGWADALVIGPGISRNQETAQLVAKLIRSYDGTILIDADGLNPIADHPEILHETHAEIVLTPHHGEFSRLSKFSVEEIAKERVEVARKYAAENNVTLVLKGSPTVIASKEGKVYVNVHGNPGMATAGSGDVLTGIIAAMLGQKLSPLDAAMAGVYIHSVAGDVALESKGIYSLIATDIIDSLPEAFKKIENGDVVEFERIS
ncbi:MAG: NAD(P)H-hydrate dehydratase [Bacteroidetes bacterium]|jgi:NAD(P)H-hydrate epimerase|nr:NAD(P)H-hydrate dehydratase [Bacteroidota bacterium]